MAINVAVTLILLIEILATLCLTGCVSRHVSTATPSLTNQHRGQIGLIQQQQQQQESSSLISTPSGRQRDGRTRKHRRRQQNKTSSVPFTASPQHSVSPQLTTTTTPVPSSSLSTKHDNLILLPHQQIQQEEIDASPTLGLKEQYFTAHQQQQQPSQSRQQDDDDDAATVSVQPEVDTQSSTLFDETKHEYMGLIYALGDAFRSLKEIADNVDNVASQLIGWPTHTHQTLVVREDRMKLAQQLEEGCVPLLIQQRVDQTNFFNRSWEEFKVGFNASNGNYWLGNELLHQLTKDGKYKLRVDLQSRNDVSKWYWAEYAEFIVNGESEDYMLQIGGFSGNVFHDHLRLYNGSQFSTYDKSHSYRGYMPMYHGFWQISHRDYEMHLNDNLCCADGSSIGGHFNAFGLNIPNNFVWCRLTSFRYLPNYGNMCALQTSRMWLICH